MSIRPRFPPEEESDSAGAGVASNGRPDVEDLHLAVHIGKVLLHEVRDGARILIAGGIGDKDLSCIGGSAFRVLDHMAHGLFYDLLLCVYSFDLPVVIVHPVMQIR